MPVEVLQVLCRQLAIPDPDCVSSAIAIIAAGYMPPIFQNRWLSSFHRSGHRLSLEPLAAHALCWTGTDRRGVLFERSRLVAVHTENLLPGVSQLSALSPSCAVGSKNASGLRWAAA